MKKFMTLLIAFSVANSAHAAIDVILRDKSEININKPETDHYTEHQNVRVTTSRVAMVDYPLLAKDFPALQKNSSESDSAWKQRVNEWLIKEMAFISIEQANQTVVNSPIQTGEQKTAYRPKGYGRAYIMPVSGGLIDAKGVGSINPQQKPHRNGLSTFGEVIRECVYEKLAEKLFDHAAKHNKAVVKTVGCYGVIDLGFDVIHADGQRSRAGMILRQAHRRTSNFNSLLDFEDLLVVEPILRTYGLTSSGETANGNAMKLNFETGKEEPFDYINIQGTDNKKVIEIVDFGAYVATEKFTRMTRNPYAMHEILWKPGEFGFVQPNEELRVPLEQWGDDGNHDPKADRPWLWAHDTANAFASGQADQSALDNHLRNMLGPFEEKLRIYDQKHP